MAEGDTQVEQAPAPQQQLPPLPPLDFTWAKVPTERPPKPVIGEDGFTLKLADYGMYGYAPDHWPYTNDMPRGSYPSPDMGIPAPYTIYEKAGVWADSAAELYEAGIRGVWKPATQVNWGSIEPIAEHVEISLDQIYTNISEQAYNSNQVLMGWLKEISYGYHEVKLYLATQVFDHARHCEVFRKRAMSNGGGLGVQTPGYFNRAVYASFKFGELVTYVNIIRTSFFLALCENSEKLARSEADRQIFELTANDLRRHLQYGIEHIKHFLQTGPQQRSTVNAWLDRGEIMLAADLRHDKPLREAYILAMGDTVAEGKQALLDLRQAQLKKYLLTLEAATVTDRAEHLQPPLRVQLETP